MANYGGWGGNNPGSGWLGGHTFYKPGEGHSADRATKEMVELLNDYVKHDDGPKGGELCMRTLCTRGGEVCRKVEGHG